MSTKFRTHPILSRICVNRSHLFLFSQSGISKIKWLWLHLIDMITPPSFCFFRFILKYPINLTDVSTLSFPRTHRLFVPFGDGFVIFRLHRVISLLFFREVSRICFIVPFFLNFSQILTTAWYDALAPLPWPPPSCEAYNLVFILSEGPIDRRFVTVLNWYQSHPHHHAPREIFSHVWPHWPNDRNIPSL